MADARSDGRTLNSNNISFMSCLWAIDDNSVKNVQILWNCILNTWFPPTQPYKIAIKAPAPDLIDDAAPPAIVSHVLAIEAPSSPGEIQERQIFMVECTGLSEDTTAGWKNAEIRLVSNIEASSSGVDSTYCACAIGTKVAFYEWTRRSQGLTAISRRLDMAELTQRPFVEDILDHVKRMAAAEKIDH